MNFVEYERMFVNEDQYWWFLARRELILELLEGLPGGAERERTILDIGCGTGANAAAFQRFGQVVGLDLSPLALDCSRRRGLRTLVQGGAEAIPIADRSAEVVVATDVIEHLDDDLAALREFHRVLKPGGRALVTVPAYEFLWSEHDDAMMHRRRYTRGLLRRRAETAGFEVERITHHTSLLFPLALGRLLKRKPRSRPPESLVTPVPRTLHHALLAIQRLERRLLRRLDFAWGLSLAAILRRPANPSVRNGAGSTRSEDAPWEGMAA